MERDAAEVEVRRRLRDVGARLSSLPDDGELLRLLQVSSAPQFEPLIYYVLFINSRVIPFQLEVIRVLQK